MKYGKILLSMLVISSVIVCFSFSCLYAREDIAVSSSLETSDKPSEKAVVKQEDPIRTHWDFQDVEDKTDYDGNFKEKTIVTVNKDGWLMMSTLPQRYGNERVMHLETKEFSSGMYERNRYTLEVTLPWGIYNTSSSGIWPIVGCALCSESGESGYAFVTNYSWGPRHNYGVAFIAFDDEKIHPLKGEKGKFVKPRVTLGGVKSQENLNYKLEYAKDPKSSRVLKFAGTSPHSSFKSNSSTCFPPK